VDFPDLEPSKSFAGEGSVTSARSGPGSGSGSPDQTRPAANVINFVIS